MAQKKTNKVSVATIEKVMKERFAGEPKTFDWYGVEIEHKENIPMEYAVTFVNNVVDTCFDKDGNYIPEFKDFLIRSFTVQMYSNVRLPQDLKKQYDILYNSDLYNVLIQHVDIVQYDTLLMAIDEKLEYRRNADVMTMRMTLNNLIAQFQNFGEQLNQVEIEDVRNIAGAINGVDLDEEKFVDAILNRKPDSEEQVIEDKENKIISIHGDDG